MSGEPDNNASSGARRTAIKNITLAGGSIAVTKWTAPVIESIVLPAHAGLTVNNFAIEEGGTSVSFPSGS